MSDKQELILNAVFGGNTIWPSAMPEGIDPDLMIELGKNPGLGVRSLHAKGITGKGVSTADSLTLYHDGAGILVVNPVRLIESMQ